MKACTRIFITRIAKDIECDAFFPAYDTSLFKVSYLNKTHSHNGLAYDFLVHERIKDSASSDDGTVAVAPVPSMVALSGAGKLLHEEYQYLNLIREICQKGCAMDDRTGVGTLSLFG